MIFLTGVRFGTCDTSMVDECMMPGGGGGGNLSFQDTRLCHSNRKSTTHKSGEISQEYTHKSGEFSENHTINPEMPKQLANK